MHDSHRKDPPILDAALKSKSLLSINANGEVFKDFLASLRALAAKICERMI